MKSYKYSSLDYSNDYIQVDTTDNELLKWIDSSIKQFSPSCSVSKAKDGTLVFRNIESKDLILGSWLRTKLCQKGWEPFAVTLSMFNGDTRSTTYHFRFEEDL